MIISVLKWKISSFVAGVEIYRAYYQSKGPRIIEYLKIWALRLELSWWRAG